MKIQVVKPYNYLAGGIKRIEPGIYDESQLGAHVAFILAGGLGFVIEDESEPDILEANEIVDGDDDPELSRDEIKSLLDEAGIEYDGRWSTEKLLSALEGA